MKKEKISLESYKTKQEWIDKFKQTIVIWKQEQQKRYEKSYKNSSMDDDYNFFRKNDDLDFFCVCHKYDDVAIEIWCSLIVQEKEEGCCVELIVNNDRTFYSYEILPFFFIFVFFFSVIAQTLFLLGVIVVYIIIWQFCKRKIYKGTVEQIVKKLESI